MLRSCAEYSKCVPREASGGRGPGLIVAGNAQLVGAGRTRELPASFLLHPAPRHKESIQKALLHRLVDMIERRKGNSDLE